MSSFFFHVIIGGGKRSTSQSNVTSLSPFFDSTSSLESSNFFTSITKHIQRRHIYGMSPIMHDFKLLFIYKYFKLFIIQLILKLSYHCPEIVLTLLKKIRPQKALTDVNALL